MTETCTCLCVVGTDLSLSNEYGNTPLHLAQSRLRILQEGSLKGRTPDTVKAEVLEVSGIALCGTMPACSMSHYIMIQDKILI